MYFFFPESFYKSMKTTNNYKNILKNLSKCEFLQIFYLTIAIQSVKGRSDNIKTCVYVYHILNRTEIEPKYQNQNQDFILRYKI